MIVSPILATFDTETTPRLRAVIGRLSRRLRPTDAAVAAGLTPTKISVLLHVARAGQVRLSELSEAEGINPTMMSRVIAALTEAGLVERASDPGDRRAALVEASKAGQKLAERIRRERTDALNVALEGLDERERSQIEAALPALERLAEQLRVGERS
ncbi:MAG TPA: MarR family transcriptional regulator [Solirubrobacteraceae bacterium]|nr:MarR family transcriptional regulator [Solirubrobacteraceae bacterium]